MLTKFKVIQELKSQGHSCLTCNSTKYAYGDVFKCDTQPNKFVSPHHLCVAHQVVVARALEQIKKEEADANGN
jgi:hypothetical protein